MDKTVTKIGFIDDPASVITAAAQSPLGVVALVIVVIAAVSIYLFRRAPQQSKLIVWLTLVAAMIGFVVLVLQTKVPGPPSLVACSARPTLAGLQGTNITIGPDKDCTMAVTYRAVGTFVRGQTCGLNPSEPIVVMWKNQEINRDPLSNFVEASVNLEGKFTVPPGVEGDLKYDRPDSKCSDPKPGAYFGLIVTINYQ